MFTEGLPQLFIILVFASVFVDLRYFRRRNKEKEYNSFELHIGSYADIVFVMLILLLILSFLGKNFNTRFFILFMNFILAMLYCGFIKSFFQLFVGWRYFWVDTNEERVLMARIMFSRGLIFIYHIFLILFFRHIVFNLHQGVSGNLISFVLCLLFARGISKRCHKINVRMEREEENERNKVQENSNYSQNQHGWGSAQPNDGYVSDSGYNPHDNRNQQYDNRSHQSKLDDSNWNPPEF